MKINTELIFRAICSFYDGEYADFTFYSIRNAVKENALQDGIKELKKLGLIEDKTTNGYAKHFKINNPLDCPNFIFDTRFDFKMKTYLLDRWKVNSSTGLFVAKSTYETKLNLMGTTSQEVLKNVTFIKNTISVPDTMIMEKDEKGYKIKNKPIPEDIRKNTYKCRYCGDENPEHFGNQHTICKKCYNTLDRNRKSYAERLYKNSKQNSKNYNAPYDLTMEYIQELLEKQNYKCAYSGIPFSNDKKDKYTYPTIDRIDSTKGYVKGNVCICTLFVNIMKNNATVDQFKDIITKIYNNKDNF